MGVRLLRRVDLWLPPLLLMGLIFVFSAQPSLDPDRSWLELAGRKLAHFGTYALLWLLWWRLLRAALPGGRAALVALLVSSLYAAGDELHQSFVDGRHGSPVDWAIDTAGAAFALLCLRATARRRAVA
jgi:VanZ family protein